MYQLAQMPDFKLWKSHQTTGTKTRSSKKKLITTRRPKTEKFKRSITYQGPKLWNSLPANFQKADSYHEFKSQVKKKNLKKGILLRIPKGNCPEIASIISSSHPIFIFIPNIFSLPLILFLAFFRFTYIHCKFQTIDTYYCCYY